MLVARYHIIIQLPYVKRPWNVFCTKTIRIQCRIERPRGPGGCLTVLHTLVCHRTGSVQMENINTTYILYDTQPHFKAHTLANVTQLNKTTTAHVVNQQIIDCCNKHIINHLAIYLLLGITYDTSSSAWHPHDFPIILWHLLASPL